MLYMMDTNIVSYYVKGRHAPVRMRLDAIGPAQLCISAVTESELLYGLLKLPQDHSLQERVPRFMASVVIRAWDSEVAQVHANLRHYLISSGQIIGEMDTMIAAHAISLEATLVTNNTRHFERVSPPLRLENWVTPGG
jgi:tRNA(fMet)-specific endonuclease VapC